MKNTYLIAGVLAASLLAGCGEKNETKVVVTTSSAVAVDANSQSFKISQGYDAPQNSRETLIGTINVKDGVVSGVSIEKNGTTRVAVEKIGAFSDAIAGEIVGKPLKNLQIGKVGGASLSSAAFNEALKGINS